MSCVAMKEVTPENQVNSEDNDSLNTKLAYEYTESFIAQCDKNMDDLNSRLTTFLGFAGVLLRFGLSLSSEYPSSILLKTLVLSLSAAAVCVSGYALTAGEVGCVVKPEVLMSNEKFQQENVRVKAFITNTWIDTVGDLEKALGRKKEQLNYTIVLLAIAACAFAISSIIVTVYPTSSC